MDKILKNNRTLLISDLENRSIELCEEATKLCKFTINPDDRYKKLGDFYYLTFQGEEIPFELLSEKNINEVDKKILLNEKKRDIYATIRVLRIAGSLLLETPECLTIISNHVKNVVRYKRNGQFYIIDYANNLIMKDDDYKRLFPYTVVQSLDTCDLVYLDKLFKGEYSSMPIELFLIAFKEMTEELSKKDKLFMPKYENSGMNGRNKYILDNSETLFWMDADHESDYINDLREVLDFTMYPDISLGVKKASGKYYEYKDYLFRLYSDCITSDKTRQVLLSDARYGICFSKALDVAFGLGLSLPDSNIRVVLGKIKINEEESFYHAWVEYQAGKSKNWYAADFTANLVMELDDYYKLRHASVINVVPMDVLRGLQSYFEIYNPHLNNYLILYFAEEILRDLEKNKTLFKGMQ